jgi:hypothetical protein
MLESCGGRAEVGGVFLMVFKVIHCCERSESAVSDDEVIRLQSPDSPPVSRAPASHIIGGGASPSNSLIRSAISCGWKPTPTMSPSFISTAKWNSATVTRAARLLRSRQRSTAASTGATAGSAAIDGLSNCSPLPTTLPRPTHPGPAHRAQPNAPSNLHGFQRLRQHRTGTATRPPCLGAE